FLPARVAEKDSPSQGAAALSRKEHRCHQHASPYGTGIFCPQDAFLLPRSQALPRAPVYLAWTSVGGSHGAGHVVGAGEEHPSDTSQRRRYYAMEPTAPTLDGCAARPHGRARRVHL